jgi:hypothetical protein
MEFSLYTFIDFSDTYAYFSSIIGRKELNKAWSLRDTLLEEGNITSKGHLYIFYK